MPSKLDGLRDQIKALLTKLGSLTALPGESHWTYRRDGSGQIQTRLSWITLTSEHDKTITELSPQVSDWIKEHYPDHVGLVGTVLGQRRITPYMLLWTAAQEAYETHKRFKLSDDELEAIVVRIDSFFASKEYEFNLYVPALNLEGPASLPAIPFPGRFSLRPITDEELTRFYGGNAIFRVQKMPTILPEFVFVAELKLPKVFGEIEGKLPIEDIRSDLDRAMLALATFKEAGAVGYDGIHFEPNKLSIGGMTEGIYTSERHIPFSVYKLELGDVSLLAEHANRFTNIHSSLEVACQRLVDAGHRSKPRDAILDAVIGLETILLWGLDGELGYRFAMNYSTLDPSNRMAGYNLAKELYRLRSKIAHGGTVSWLAPVGGKVRSPRDIANLAKECLRSAITTFMVEPERPAYLKGEEYWLPLHMR